MVHGPEEAVVISWPYREGGGDLSTVCWDFHHSHLGHALSRSAVFHSFVCYFVGLCLYFNPLRSACHQHSWQRVYLSVVFVQRTWISDHILCLWSMTIKGNLKCTSLYLNIHNSGWASIFCASGHLHVDPTMCVCTYFYNIVLNGKKIKVYRSIYDVISFSKKMHILMYVEKNVMWHDWFLKSLRGS